VGSKNGGFVECAGGQVVRNNKSGINALSLGQVKGIAKRFEKLNPYDARIVSEILKIEKINYSYRAKTTFRQLFGYAVSAKRYALYTRNGDEIEIKKASGHGLGYLFAPRESKSEKRKSRETPVWVEEAWAFLLRKSLKLSPNDPSWLDLPAMMRMAVTTPNVFKQRRPEWLGPFNFFLFPLISEEFRGYPKGFDKSTFIFITPYESNRKEWKSLKGINLMDGRAYDISTEPDLAQEKVLPESFRILLRRYLSKSEVKSLAPDGKPCTGTTRGLLQRATVTASNIVPVGKETDRRWEQGEDPRMVDSDVFVYENRSKLVVANASERESWEKIGFRRLMRECKLSQAPISKAIKGTPVRLRTLSTIRETVSRMLGKSSQGHLSGNPTHREERSVLSLRLPILSKTK
jgi:hypothetical protein